MLSTDSVEYEENSTVYPTDTDRNLYPLYNGHHWFGHVADAALVNLSFWILVVPATIALVALALSTGYWVILLLIWFFWPKGK